MEEKDETCAPYLFQRYKGPVEKHTSQNLPLVSRFTWPHSSSDTLAFRGPLACRPPLRRPERDMPERKHALAERKEGSTH